MLAFLGVALALNFAPQVPPPTPPAQQGQTQPRRRPVVVRDSSSDSSGPGSRWRRPGVRRAVTAEIFESAFKDPTAKTTLLKARAARLTPFFRVRRAWLLSFSLRFPASLVSNFLSAFWLSLSSFSTDSDAAFYLGFGLCSVLKPSPVKGFMEFKSGKAHCVF